MTELTKPINPEKLKEAILFTKNLKYVAPSVRVILAAAEAYLKFVAPTEQPIVEVDRKKGL